MQYDLGCGELVINGYIRVDQSEKCNPDIVADITTTPWDWMKDADDIRIDNVLEHIYPGDLINVINECHTRLIDGGTLWIRVPLLKLTEKNLNGVFTDPTHVNQFTMTTFDYWEDKKHGEVNRHKTFGKDYGIIPWSKVESREWENNDKFLICEMIK